MSLSQQAQRLNRQAQRWMETLQPGVIQIDGREIACAVAGARQSLRLDEGGSVIEADVAFRVAKAQLPNAPEIGTVVLWKGRKYRIAFDPKVVRGHQTDVAWYLGCNAAYE